MKRMGDRGEPWGTPYSGKYGEEEKPGNYRLVDMSERTEDMNFTSHWVTHLFLTLKRNCTGTIL
jgi:hypothetical protein